MSTRSCGEKNGHRVLRKPKSEAPRPRGGASRRGSFVDIVPLEPAYKAGLSEHVSAKEGQL